MREALLAHDAYARQAARACSTRSTSRWWGSAPARSVPPLQAGNNFFSRRSLREVVAAGAVGQLCLRFLDAQGEPVASRLDDLVTGVTPDQLRAAKRRWVVAGGPSKYAAIRAVWSAAGPTRS